MNFSAITQRSVLRKPGESSPLWSPREPNAIGNLWKPANGGLNRDDNLTNQISALQAQVRELQRHQRKLGSGMHPFKIYNFPKHLRRFQNDDDWRRFKVRGGMILSGIGGYGGVSSGSIREPANGTDGATVIAGNPFAEDFIRSEIPPNDATSVSATWHEISVPISSSDICYFWYSFSLGGLLSSGNTHGVMAGASATTATSLETGQTGLTDPNWTNFPSDDPYRKLIGQVSIMADDTFAPQLQPNIPHITQWINHDIFAPQIGRDGLNAQSTRGAQMVMQGIYRAAQFYFVGDVVTQTITNGDGFKTKNEYIYFPPHTSTYQASLGPIVNIDPNSNTPDPWLLLSATPIDATYRIAAFDASKAYLRTA